MGVEFGDGGFRDDNGSDAGDILAGAVVEFGDLLVGVDAGETIEMELGSGVLGVGVDVDVGELGFELDTVANRNDTLLGAEIVVAIVFETETAVEPVGHGESIEKNRVTADFTVAVGRVEEN